MAGEKSEVCRNGTPLIVAVKPRRRSNKDKKHTGHTTHSLGCIAYIEGISHIEEAEEVINDLDFFFFNGSII